MSVFSGPGGKESGGQGSGWKNAESNQRTTTTTTRTTMGGQVNGLDTTQIGKDPAYQDLYVENVDQAWASNGKVRTGEYTDLQYDTNNQGELQATYFNTKTGQRSRFPTSSNQRRLMENKSRKDYEMGIIQGTIDPIDAVKKSNYSVTRDPVETTTEVTPSGTNVGQSGNQNDTGAGTETGDTEIRGEQPISEDDVKKDHTKVKVLTSPELDPDFGEPIEGTGGFQYLTEDQIDELKAAGRIKPSHARKAKRLLDIQQKAFEKGTWPPPDGNYTYDTEGNLVDSQGTIRNPDGTVQIPSGQTIAGTFGNDGADVREVIQPEVRGPRVALGGAGVPATHKVKLYTKDPSWLTGILSPLLKTSNGVIFPYTPTININHSASYGTYDINQSVNQPHYYMMTPNITINVTAIFTANTAKEAEYLLAAMHFFRTATKSDFGAYSNGFRRADAGTPPPVLVFSGYGDEQFKNIPVVLRNVNFTLPEDVDYVSVTTQSSATVNLVNGQAVGNTAEEQTIFNAGAEGNIVDGDETSIDIPEEASSVPTSMLFAFDLAPQYPPSQLRDEWNLGKYASGELLRKGYI